MKQTKHTLTFMLSIFLAMSFSGCYTAMLGTTYKYDYAMIKKVTSSPKVDTLKSMSFDDDKITSNFIIGDKQINFTLKNKTNDVMKIIWDEASIVQFGTTHKVMHNGVKYIDRNSSQPPSVVPPQASINDLVLPADNVYYRDGYYSTYSSRPGGWEEHDLFPKNDLNKPAIKETIMNLKGQAFSIYLPIQYQGKTLDYTFNFTITNVQAMAK
jgi:hypothetical protein